MAADCDDRRYGRLSLEQVYAEHVHGAARLGFLLTGDLSLAEDLAHEAFVRLAGRVVQFRDPGACAVYLRRTVVNLARMRFRRLRVERAYLRRLAAEQREPLVDDPDGVEVMRTALLRLPYRHRAAIVLRFYVDLTDVEIADIIGCSRSTVRSLVARGLTQLRDLLEEEG